MNASNQTEHQQTTPTPKPATHSDDHRSAMPERDDEHRKQAPSDQPGKKPGEGEPPVG